MSEQVTLEDCLKMFEDPKLFIDDDKIQFVVDVHKTLLSLPSKEVFNLAKQLLKEIEIHNNNYYSSSQTVRYAFEHHDFVRILIDSFETCQEISRKEFLWLLEESGVNITARITRNIALPIDILLAPSLIERHLGKSDNWLIELCQAEAKGRRRQEIINYYRDIVPNSKAMSDEIVLSVVGITL